MGSIFRLYLMEIKICLNNAEKQLDWQANQQWIDIVHDYIDWFKNN